MAIRARRHEVSNEVDPKEDKNLSIIFNLDIDSYSGFASAIFDQLAEAFSDNCEHAIKNGQDSKSKAYKDIQDLITLFTFIRYNLKIINYLEVKGTCFSLSIKSYTDDGSFRTVQLAVNRASDFYLILTGQPIVDHATQSEDNLLAWTLDTVKNLQTHDFAKDDVN